MSCTDARFCFLISSTCAANALCADCPVRELLTQGRPLLLVVDGEGAAHYWDSYEFAVAVVAPDSDAEKVVLAETRLKRSESGANTLVQSSPSVIFPLRMGLPESPAHLRLVRQESRRG